jgi:hypothetical protein
MNITITNLLCALIVMEQDVCIATGQAVCLLLHQNGTACIARESDAYTVGLPGGLVPKGNMTDGLNLFY